MDKNKKDVKVVYERADLIKKLKKAREDYIKKGGKLLSWEEVLEEVRKRRYG